MTIFGMSSLPRGRMNAARGWVPTRFGVGSIGLRGAVRGLLDGRCAPEYDQVDVKPRCGLVVLAPVSRRVATPGASHLQQEGAHPSRDYGLIENVPCITG